MSLRVRLRLIDKIENPIGTIMGLRQQMNLDLMAAKKLFEKLQNGESIEHLIESESDDIIKKIELLGIAVVLIE